MARSTLSDNNQRAENRWVPFAIGAAAVVALTAVQLVRLKGAPVTDTLWAEDGKNFLTGGLEGVSPFAGYAGYLVLPARVVGWLGAQLPLSVAAWWFSVVPAVVAALIALAVFRLSDFLVRSPWLRAVLAVAFVLPPILVYETMAATANLAWPILGALFWALARPLKGRGDLVVCLAIAIGAAVSTSLALLFVPLAVFVAVLRRHDRRALVVPIAFGLGCAAQLLTVLTTSTGVARGSASVLGLPRLYIVGVVGETVLGHRQVDLLWLDHGVVPFVVLAVAVASVLAVLWARADGDGRLWAGIALAMSIGLYCFAAFWRGSHQVALVEGVRTGSGARYAGVGLQLLLAAVVILIDRAKLTEMTRRVLVVLVVAQAVLVPLTAFRLTATRSDGPRWGSALSAAERACRRDRDPSAVQLIPITPRNRGWFARVPCSALD